MIHFGLSGHGFLDLAGYSSYFAGRLENYDFAPELLARSLDCTDANPKVQAPRSGRGLADGSLERLDLVGPFPGEAVAAEMAI